MSMRSLQFGFNCYVAAIAALLIAMSFDLPNPWWAVITVFITSQATVEGAIWAKGLFRVIGTLIGLGAALIIIPNLVDYPDFMLLALAAWLALCLFISLHDRTPAGYMPMLAGYTAILVGMPIVDNPVNIFTTAVARTEEILIGVVCASVAHAVFFSRSVHGLLQAKVEAGMATARADLLAVIGDQADERVGATRMGLAASMVDIALQASILQFEPPRGQGRRGVANALAERLAGGLLPLISGIRELRASLGPVSGSPPLHDALTATARWIESDDLPPASYELLMNTLEAAMPEPTPKSEWMELVEVALVERLRMLIKLWYECLQLAAALARPDQPLTPVARQLLSASPKLSLHVDHGIALWSALTAASAVLVCGGLALWIQWPPATVAIGLAAIGTSFFATFDNPTPILQRMLLWSVVTIPVAALYVFAVLPAIDGFIPLAIVLFPVIAIPSALLVVPRFGLGAIAFLMTSTTIMGIQSAYRGDLEAFANLSIAAIGGMAVALFMTRILRVIGTQFAARRIIRAGWQDLVRLVRRPAGIEAFVMRMLDRVGLLLPRVSPTSPLAANTLRDLRIGVNLHEMMAVAPALGVQAAQPVARLRTELESYFRTLMRDPDSASQPALGHTLDQLGPLVLSHPRTAERRRPIAAWVGLRSILVPERTHEP